MLMAELDAVAELEAEAEAVPLDWDWATALLCFARTRLACMVALGAGIDQKGGSLHSTSTSASLLLLLLLLAIYWRVHLRRQRPNEPSARRGEQVTRHRRPPGGVRRSIEVMAMPNQQDGDIFCGALHCMLLALSSSEPAPGQTALP